LTVFTGSGMHVLRRWLLPFVLGLVGLQGCGPLPLVNGQTLYVMVVTQRRLDWLRRETVQQELWAPLLEEFHNLHPNVRVSLYTVDEEQVEAELNRRTARGLGPDLILVRAPMANTLLQEGLILPVPSTRTMERSVAQVSSNFLARVRHGSHLAGLPVYELVTLACFNRQRIPTPPRTTEELLAMAAAGRTIGLSVDPYGIWWTSGTRGADHALAPLILGGATPSPAVRDSELKAITAWLTWLRLLAQQSKVDLASGPEELTEALKTSRLDWIPCFSLTLDLLRASMGDRLGVSALPSGPGGPPSPFTTLQVWSFGLDSSPLQRQYAADLAKLSVDPLLQRRYVLDTLEVLPVNGSVQTPVASSGVLAVLAEAQRQFLEGSPLLSTPFTVNHLNVVTAQLETVIRQVMVGVLTPREGAEKIFALRTNLR
jgi:arabinogalactan oligomer/maltooligosaccharide transport system substrate-binding protein